MDKFTRRDAAKGLAASLVGITAMSDRAMGMEPKIAEEHRQQKYRESEKARERAFLFLMKVGHFDGGECEVARKAIMKGRTEEEKKWEIQFMSATGLMLIWTSHLLRMPMYWQAIRLSFLLGVDGFELLQIDAADQESAVSFGEKAMKIKAMAGNKSKITIPKIDIPHKVFGG